MATWEKGSQTLTTENVERFIKGLMTSLVQSTKSSNSIPNGSEYEYFSNFEEFRRGMGDLSVDLLEQIQKICHVVQRSSEEAVAPHVDLEDAALYDLVVDMIDILLESAESKMNQVSGETKELASSIKDSLKTDKDNIFANKSKDIAKPQLQFFDDIDNSRRRPFYPRLKTKPHSIVPLDISEVPAQDDPDDDLSVVKPSTYFPHPYSQEILCVSKRSQYQNQIADAALVVPNMPSLGQPFELVESVEALERMTEELDGVKEVAVDLEHHHWRSFLGLTCLMQVSSRDKDYIIDVLALRRNMELLLPLFADPDVVKVLHGCSKDVMWLQRDFGIYVVNCFDTYQAAKILRYPALSLAHLLKYYCGVTLNKKHQLADWRERPLPPELIEYAKLDTHYLLYVYDCLRRDVHSTHGNNGIEAVLEASRRTCLQRYEKAPFFPLGYVKLVPSSHNLSFEQNSILSCLWNWRDITARQCDESCGYIMSNAELLRISMAVPRDANAIKATGPLSVYVREHLDDITAIIREELRNDGGIVEKDRKNHYDAPFEHEVLASGSGTSRESRKRNSIEIGMGANRHQIGRMKGYTTVAEFTPCLRPLPPMSSFHVATNVTRDSESDIENVHRNFHNVVEKDQEWKKKLFEEANWPLSGSYSTTVKVDNTDDPLLVNEVPPSINHEMSARVEKSEGDMRRYSIFHEYNSGFNAEDGVNQATSSAKTSKISSKGYAESAEVVEPLPKSLSDIYNISNRNRWRNKDKKRNRESGDALPSNNSVLESAQSSEKSDWYHVEKGKNLHALDNVESSLDFATNIGWLNGDANSRNEIKKKHNSNEGSGFSHSQDQSSTSSSESSAATYDGKKTSQKSSKQGQKEKNVNKEGSYSYDYSRVANMGAMSTVTGDREGGKYNPFVSNSQSGSGGYSNASNRYSSSNSSKSRKQPPNAKSKVNSNIVERRDSNRSHIFSTSSNK